MSHSVRAVVFAPLVAVAFSACAEDLPQRQRIDSIRVLAIRADVEEAAPTPASATRCEALPFESVTLTPWIVDEDGAWTSEDIAAHDPIWLACNLQPFQGPLSCWDALLPLELDDIPDCEVPRFDDLGDLEGGATGPCRLVDGSAATPRLTVGFAPNYLVGGDIGVIMFSGTDDTTRSQVCARAYLEQRDAIPPGCILASQRISVGPDTVLHQLAIDFGFAEEGTFGPGPERQPDADRNPRLEQLAIEIYTGNSSEPRETFDIAPGDEIAVRYGDRIRIVAAAREEDLQTYLVSNGGGSYEEREETYTGLWFSTWGSLLADSSNDVESYTEWTATVGDSSVERPDADRAAIFYVLRDNRQGVDFVWFTVALSD